MKTLIVAEHDNQTLKAAIKRRGSRQQLGGDIDVLVVGSGCQQRLTQLQRFLVWLRYCLLTTPLMKTSSPRMSLAVADVAAGYDAVLLQPQPTAKM